MINNNHITISAAGQGSRIRSAMNEMGFANNMPKSLLPSGNGETLLGRICRQAEEIGHVKVYVNYDHVKTIGECKDIPKNISLLINRNIYGPLGPLYLDLMQTKKRSFMAAGDFWADFKWKEFLDFHESHDKPVSILIGPSVATVGGARFNVNEDNSVISWERVDNTTSEDLINIGAYIVDPEKAVMKKLSKLIEDKNHKEDPFNDALIKDGLMAAYVLSKKAYNVNNIEVYKSLLENTKKA